MKRIKTLANKYFRKLKAIFKKKRNQRKAIYIGGALLISGLFVGLGLTHKNAKATQHNLESHIQRKDTELTERQYRLQKLESELKTVQEQKATTEAQLQEKAAKEAELNAQIEKLNRDLQSKRANQIKLAAAAKPTIKLASKIVAGCGDNYYANYIYSHESGCNLYARNKSSGACGVGQALPCSKLTNVCDLSSYTCQNNFFTNYVNSRYGGWRGAYEFWLANKWY